MGFGPLSCKDEEPAGIDTARSDMEPLVLAACDWMFGCCSDAELVYQVGNFTADAANCSERLLDAITSGVPLDLVQPGLSDDPAAGLLLLALSINEKRVDVQNPAVLECAEATSDRACNIVAAAPDPMAVRCVPGEDVIEEVPCDPEEMFIGKQAVGEECSGDFECSPGLRCVSFGVAGVCARRGLEGEFCFADEECGDGLICGYEDGTCSPGAGLGKACAFANALNPLPGTETVRCEEGLSCNPDTLLCVGGFCAPGAPCGDLVNDTDCPEGYFCSGDLTAGLFTCQTPGPEGTPCFRDETCASNFCDPFLETCSALSPDGVQCDFDEECSSGFCDFNIPACAPTVPNGGMCFGGNSQCADGFCNPMDGLCTPYASEGGACQFGNECDPESDLFCVDMVCRRAPFANGVTCGDGSQCMTNVCFMGVCGPGTPIGAACSQDGTIAECVVGSFCDIVVGAATGTCVELLRSGQACLRSEQCWGECTVRYGALICDQTPAFALGEVWCDGF